MAIATLLCGLLLGLIVGSLFLSWPRGESESERNLALSVTLLGSWTSGDHEQASEDVQHLAISTVKTMRAHIRAGTSPLSDAPEFTGSMRDAGAAMGHPPQPASWTKQGEAA